MTALTYVITHPEFRAVKIGYTDSKSRRLEAFGRRGWRPYRALEVATSEIARCIEQASLFDIRHRRLVPQYLTANEMQFGWTETSSLGLVTAREVWDLVCWQASLIYLAPHVTGPTDGRRRNGGTPPRRVPGDSLPNSRMARRQARIEQTTPRFLPKDTP